MNRMPNNARTLETLGDAIYRDKDGNIRIKSPVFIEGDKVNLITSITDSNSRRRFIEDNIIPETIEGVTFSYAKWGLSGYHFLLVICGEVTDETLLENGQIIANIELPTHIANKIIPIVGSVVVSSSTNMWGSNYSTQTLQFNLIKSQENEISIRVGQDVTLTANRTFRIEIDLFID